MIKKLEIELMYKKGSEKSMNNNESCHKTSINWYPGHMVKAQNEIKNNLKLIDIVVEVLDATYQFHNCTRKGYVDPVVLSGLTPEELGGYINPIQRTKNKYAYLHSLANQ